LLVFWFFKILGEWYTVGAMVAQEAENGIFSHEMAFLEGLKAMLGHRPAVGAVS
jgi:hypothetical protein